jgi:photosystem II stability/assembly factor-like uncharacterized protein
MNKLFFVCVGMFCAFATVKADGFYSVHSPNGYDVWAVGNGGSVFHSVNGGVTWGSYPRGTAALRSVYAFGNAVWTVGDNGTCYYSEDLGASWSSKAVFGMTALKGIVFANPRKGWIVGANGSIFATTDGGQTWNAQASTTTQTLTAVSFSDSLVGYASGMAGTLLKTVNGGASWASIAGAGWTNNILSVRAKGDIVFVTGTEGFAYGSTNGGSTWTSYYFKTDSRVDVNNVFIKDANNIVFVGGGGFIRYTQDGGRTYTWPLHQLYGKINDVYFSDDLRGWVCSEKNNAIMRTTDGGVTWALPQGTTISYSWTQKFSAGSIGNTFMINPWNRDRIYVVMSSGTVYMSGDRGETWVQTATVTGGGSTWSFYISPKDTNLWVVANSGGGKSVKRSTNRGVTWTTTLTKNFTGYGMPLEMDPEHPDTLIFAEEKPSTGDAVLFISSNFGATWDTLARPNFRSPCDLVIVPDNPSLWYCGDGVTGSGQAIMWRSVNYGKTWTSIYSSPSSEIPMIAASRHRNTEAFATAWSSTSVMKSTNQGTSWSSIASTTSTWGLDIAKDDPNVVMYGTYGGSTSYLSYNAGASFTATSLSGSNSGMLFYDRGTVLAHQASGGVWKYVFTYTVPTNNQTTLALTSPNGGEVWQYGTTRNITWNSTNISAVKIEYKTSPSGSWQTIVASTPGGAGSYAWQIPNSPTTQAMVNVSDAVTGNPVDSSNATFSITVATISSQPASLNFGAVSIGSSRTEIVTLTNNGTGPLVISSIGATNPSFVPGRTSFSIPASQSDTLSIRFTPNSVQTFNDQLNIICNAPGSPYAVPVSGSGTSSSALSVLVPNGGESWEVSTTHDITWTAFGVTNLSISYKVAPTATWQPIASSVPASQGSYSWLVPNTPTTQARVRIFDLGTGIVVDSSDGFFTIHGTTSVAEGGIPTRHELSQNYPNPFNPTTVIRYGVPKEEVVRLKVFNMIGQEVATLVNERKAAGRYSVTFDTQRIAGSVSSGLYFYRLSAGDFVEIRKMMLLK